MVLDANGQVGIGITNVVQKLEVNGSVRVNTANNVYNKLFVLWDANPSDAVSTATYFYGFGVNGSTLRYQVPSESDVHRFYGYVTQYGYIDNGTGFVNTFTGQHRSFPEPSLTSTADLKQLVGLIACASGRHVSVNQKVPASGKAAITISEAVPTVRLSSAACDPAVFGVISDVEDPENREDRYGSFVATYEGIPGDTRLFINSLGEGAIWVTDANGPFANGDFIASSVVPGYGAKQADGVLRNHTVAKITMDCDFSGALVPKRRLKKKTVTKEVTKTVKTERTVTDQKEVIEYDAATGHYVRKTVTETRTVTDIVYDEVDLYDEAGNVVGKHKIERTVTETKTLEENDLDAHGNLQWEDTEELEEPYEMRYVLEDGTQISRDEYLEQTSAGNASPVAYRAAFVACTYHCG